ncbi:hypothetical protein D3C76_419440 [compost metagenome]
MESWTISFSPFLRAGSVKSMRSISYRSSAAIGSVRFGSKIGYWMYIFATPVTVRPPRLSTTELVKPSVWKAYWSNFSRRFHITSLPVLGNGNGTPP